MDRPVPKPMTQGRLNAFGTTRSTYLEPHSSVAASLREACASPKGDGYNLLVANRKSRMMKQVSQVL